MGSGLIISTSEPEKINRYTWMKPKPDGSREWYELANDHWALVRTDLAAATADHSHSSYSGTVKIANKRITIVLGAVTAVDDIAVPVSDPI